MKGIREEILLIIFIFTDYAEPLITILHVLKKRRQTRIALQLFFEFFNDKKHLQSLTQIVH